MVLGNISCDLEARGQGQIMYFLVNAVSLKRIDVATSNCVPD